MFSLLTKEYFTFTLDMPDTGRKVRVTVYRPRSTGKDIPRLTSGARKPPTADVTKLLGLLKTSDLYIPPAPTATLVKIGKSLRIDTQPASTVFRNIHIQFERLSYSVVTIENGGELCALAGKEHELLKYVKEGLFESYKSRKMFTIKVTVEEEVKLNKWVISENVLEVTARLINSTKSAVFIGLKSYAIHQKMTIIKGLFELVQATSKKPVLKLLEKEVGLTLAKKIPLVSICVGVCFGAYRAVNGDFTGSLAEVASGVAASFPGPGTAASVAIDIGLVVRDVTKL